MSKINYLNFFVPCSGDMTADFDNLHVKRIHLKYLADHLYIVKEDRV
jgi:hypothetical protein